MPDDSDFLDQLTARIQALEFLTLAIVRAQLHAMPPEDAAETCESLKRQFATLTIPPDAAPGADLDRLMRLHRDAQHFLDRYLRQARPTDPGATER